MILCTNPLNKRESDSEVSALLSSQDVSLNESQVGESKIAISYDLFFAQSNYCDMQLDIVCRPGSSQTDFLGTSCFLVEKDSLFSEPV